MRSGWFIGVFVCEGCFFCLQKVIYFCSHEVASLQEGDCCWDYVVIEERL